MGGWGLVGGEPGDWGQGERHRPMTTPSLQLLRCLAYAIVIPFSTHERLGYVQKVQWCP